MSFFYLQEEPIDERVHVIAGSGELDMTAAPRLKQAITRLIDGGKRDLIVDLTAATFIDSTGIGVLVGALRRVREARGSLSVVCDDENMLEVFDIVGMDRVIPLHRSLGDALAALGQIA